MKSYALALLILIPAMYRIDIAACALIGIAGYLAYRRNLAKSEEGAGNQE